MLNALKNENNITMTENGAVTLKRTQSDCLDLFATIGALRQEADAEILSRFVRAYTENRDLAMKTLFYARDVRGGLGERRVFRTVLKWLAANAPDSVRKNVPYIAEFGRWDDLLTLLGTPCQDAAIACIRLQLAKDLLSLESDGEVSLLGKWLPSVNASAEETKRQAKAVARALGMADAPYRKLLSRLRARIRIIENNLRERDYTFDYEKQPSKAMLKYRKAFRRNDAERYGAFLGAVEKGEAKLHAGTLMPYELVEPILKQWQRGYWLEPRRELTAEETASCNAAWNALPDFAGEQNALAVIDTSGSMYRYLNPIPAAVALSLGLYFAERNRGAFRNHFIEFSEKPELIEIKGETFVDRLRYLCTFNRIANTDLEAVFELILRAAVRNSLPQEELPAALYIISDMEFDACVSNRALSNFENAKARFAAYGYTLPGIVFWNVSSRSRQQPVRMNEQGVALVSGCTPRLFRQLAKGIPDPYTVMLETLSQERYARIAA